MNSFSFKPNINSIINLNDSNFQRDHNHLIHLNFYAIEQPNNSNYTPEIWTDAPNHLSIKYSSNSKLQWSAVPFHPIKPFNDTATIWHAKLTFKTHQQHSIDYKFTYRLIKSSSHSTTLQSNDQQIIWLGSIGQDGQIKFNSEPKNSLKDILFQSFSKQSLEKQTIQDQRQLGSIDYHLFTLKTTSPQDQAQSKTDHQKTSNSITLEHTILLPDHFLNSLKFDGLAFVRSKPTWFNPHPFIYLSEISSSFDTQLIIIHDPREEDQKNLLILIPISTNSSSSIIRHTTSSPITICTTTTADATPPPTIKFLIINAPQSQLNHIIHRHALMLDHPSIIRHLKSEYDQSITIKPKKLGYCTWDSLGPDYRLSNVIQVLKSFQKSGIIDLIDRVLLDDGWQDVNGRFLSGWDTKKGWMDLQEFENGKSNSTNPSDDANNNLTFSSPSMNVQNQGSGLARAVSLIRNFSNQSIKLVGVWVTITGYWCGLDPQSEIMKNFQLQTWLIQPSPQSSKSNDPSYWMLPKKSCIRPFWDAYFKYLKYAGVQFIKIDNQAGLDRLSSCQSDPTEDVEVYKTTLIDVVDDLARQYFGITETQEEDNTIIRSMTHSPQIWFRQHLAASKSSLDQPKSNNEQVDLGILAPSSNCKRVKKVMRTSDDFFPDLIDFSGHQWHILSNSFNAILANGLGFIPDFDMTMTKHKFSHYHAAFRVFSSAQVYLTDRKDEHELLTCRKLTAPLKTSRGNFQAGVIQSMDGAGCVLSSSCLGQSAKDISLPDSPWGLLKVGLPASYAGGGLIGIWNVKQSSQAATIAADVITARDIAEIILSSHSNDQNSRIFPSTDTPDLHQNEDGHQLENFVIFHDDHLQRTSSEKDRNRRIEVIEDFDSNLEINFRQHTSRPIIATGLCQNNHDQNSFEIWRLCRLLDLPFNHKKDISSIQVASLGLFNQYAGLCAVMTCTPTMKLLIQKAQKAENHKASQVIKMQPAESNGPTQTEGSLNNRKLSSTAVVNEPDQRGDRELDGSVNAVGLGCRNDQKKLEGKFQKFCKSFFRNPIKTVKIEIREFVNLIILLTWKSLKSISFYFTKASYPKTSFSPKTSSSDDHGQRTIGCVSTSLTDTSCSIDGSSERTPLLLSHADIQSSKPTNYVAPIPTSLIESPPLLIPSLPKVDTSTNGQQALEFYTCFTAQIGFLIRMKFSNQMVNGSKDVDDNRNKSLLIQKLQRSIEVRVDDNILPINSIDQKSISIEVLNNRHSSFSPNAFSSSSENFDKRGDGKNQVAEFLLSIDLNHIQPNSKFNSSSLTKQGGDENDDDGSLLSSLDRNQDFWLISIQKKS